MELDGLVGEIVDLRLAASSNEDVFILLLEAQKRIKEGRMWLGDTLGALGHELPPEFADKNDQERKDTDPARKPDTTPPGAGN